MAGQETGPSVQEVLEQVMVEGVPVEEIAEWRSQRLAALLLRTESGASYLVEPQEDQPALITRVAEQTPFHGDYRLPADEAIVRRQGNPSRSLRFGAPVDIYGLPRRGTEFDPDSSYQTLPLVGITLLRKC